MSDASGSAGRFVLEAIDPETACIGDDVAFEVAELASLYELLGTTADEFEEYCAYDLRPEVTDRLKEHYRVELGSQNREVWLRKWGPLDALPYRVHTGRELTLMLASKKPLAAFVDDYPSNSDGIEVIPERAFELYVQSGRFVKREELTMTRDRRGKDRGLRRVLYALPNQQWRIEAYLLLMSILDQGAWDEGLERMQGALLGYEVWQTDAFLKMQRELKASRTRVDVT